MHTEDLARHRTLMDQADECRRRADEAIQAGEPLTAQTWLNATEAALAAARLASPVDTLDFEEALRDALPSILLPLHGGMGHALSDEAERLQVKLGDGSVHLYQGSYRTLVGAVRRGERVPLADWQLRREVFEPVLAYVPPGWLGPIVVDRDMDHGEPA